MMRLHGFLTAVGGAALLGVPLVAATPAMAFGTWNTPGYSVQMRLPAVTSPWPEVAQVPVFGGPRYIAEQPRLVVAPQTAELTGDGADHAPTFVAPGVQRNAAGQLEVTP